MSYVPRLKKYYKKEVIFRLKSDFNLKNVMQVPDLEKIVLSMGMGGSIENSKLLESNGESLMLISGQKPVTTVAKKSISNFKLRKGMSLGLKVTLRKNKMWEFLDRFLNIALPRVRDFRGVNSKLDGKGNLSIGIKEQIIFPEVNYDKVEKITGLNVALITNANDDIKGKALLSYLGVPFRR